MSEIDRFLSSYNKLDSLCRLRFEMDDRSESAIIAFINELRHSGYYLYVDLADDLDTIRNLRNSIVHCPSLNDESLFALNPKANEILAKVISIIENPPTALSRSIPLNKLFVVSLSDNVLSCVKAMDEKGYSHAPVLDDSGKLIGVFSIGLVFSVLASRGTANFLDGDKIGDLMAYLPLDAHRNERYAFLSRYSKLEEATKMFEDSKAKYGKRLGLIFLTEHGRKEEKVLAALTPAEVLR